MSSDGRMLLYKQALTLWGAEAQWQMVIEEAAELVQAICHDSRVRPGSLAEVIDAVADMEIMMEQVRLLLADHIPAIERVRGDKLARLQRRLDEAVRQHGQGSATAADQEIVPPTGGQDAI